MCKVFCFTELFEPNRYLYEYIFTARISHSPRWIWQNPHKTHKLIQPSSPFTFTFSTPSTFVLCNKSREKINKEWNKQTKNTNKLSMDNQHLRLTRISISIQCKNKKRLNKNNFWDTQRQLIWRQTITYSAAHENTERVNWADIITCVNISITQEHHIFCITLIWVSIKMLSGFSGDIANLNPKTLLFFMFLILRDFLPVPKGYHQAIKRLARWNKSCITFICPTIYIHPWGQITEQMQGLKPQSFYLICSNQAIYIVVSLLSLLLSAYFWTCIYGAVVLFVTGYWPACTEPKRHNRMLLQVL